MTRLLHLLLFGLLLTGATSCQNKDPEPAPELTGSWTGESVTAYHYDQADRVVLTVGPKPPSSPYKLVISADSMITYATNMPTPYRLEAISYRRQGDVLTYFYGSTSQIKELTAHTLVLYSRGVPNYATGRVDIEVRLTR